VTTRDRLLGDPLDFQHPVQAGNVTGGQDSAHVLTAEVLTDNDLSAYRGSRARRIGRCWTRSEPVGVDAVIAWHNDRLHRSPRELEEYIAACEPQLVPTH